MAENVDNESAEIVDIPVIGHIYGTQTRVGAATFKNNVMSIDLDDTTTDVLHALVKKGAELKAVHINIEMLAAWKKGCNHNNISDCSAAGCPGMGN